jgi:hypothetical protein
MTAFAALRSTLLVCALGSSSALFSPSALAADAPYAVSVTASVLFAADGTAKEIAIIDEAKHPAAFVSNVKARLQRARIPPQMDAGTPATFRTGVLMDFVVTPGENGAAGKVAMSSLVMSPLPTKQYFAAYPKDISQTGGWKGSVQASCVVGIEGRCTTISIDALPGMPESVRRYAKASLEGWLFQPQELGGKPVEGEYKISMDFETLDSTPDNLREPKLNRVLQGR